MPRLAARLLPACALACLLAGLAAAPSAADEPKRGGTLVFGTSADALSLDPPNQWDGASARVINNLYENLVAYDPANLEIRPGLATTWEISLDRKVWTFTLREGVRFHDGTPFGAEDVRFNFDRQMNPASPWAFGRCECFRANFAILDTVEVMDARTVRFRLKRPYVPFIEQLGMAPMAIASPTAIRKYREEFLRHPVGTGPFVFVEWVPGERIVIAANPAYHGAKARLDQIVFQVIPDNRLRRVKLSGGALDAMDKVNPDEIDVIERNPRLQVLRCPGLNVGYVAMNLKRPPFDRREVRLAVNHAINKAAIVDYLYQGLGVPATTPIPPGMWGANEGIKPCDYDPALARRLLAGAGFPKGFATTLYVLPISVDSIPNPEAVADALIGNLREVGITVTKFTCEWKAYQERILAGEHEMAMLSWTADIPDPDNFLYTLLSSDNARPGYAENIAFYENPAFDALLAEAQITYGRPGRITLYRKAQALFATDVPWIPLAHTQVVLACRADVKGLVALPISNDNFSDVWLDRDGR